MSFASTGLGMLTPHSKTPVMTETSVIMILLQSISILTDLVMWVVGHNLWWHSSLDIFLSVQEILWKSVFARIEHNGDEFSNFLIRQFSCPLVTVYFRPLAHYVGITGANYLDICESLAEAPYEYRRCWCSSHTKHHWNSWMKAETFCTSIERIV